MGHMTKQSESVFHSPAPRVVHSPGGLARGVTIQFTGTVCVITPLYDLRPQDVYKITTSIVVSLYSIHYFKKALDHILIAWMDNWRNFHWNKKLIPYTVDYIVEWLLYSYQHFFINSSPENNNELLLLEFKCEVWGTRQEGSPVVKLCQSFSNRWKKWQKTTVQSRTDGQWIYCGATKLFILLNAVQFCLLLRDRTLKSLCSAP